MPRYPGGLIRKTPVTPAGPIQNGAASGVWSLADAAYWTKQGLWPIAGNFLAVEDVFSTYLYTGNGSTQTITNGIDLAGKGGLVWIKKRNASGSHFLVNSASPGFRLETDTAGAQGSQSLLSLTSSGFSLLLGNAAVNGSGSTYASWTFREAPNFFDIVTYTGNGAAGRQIAHNLGSVPGMIIVKRTDAAANWQVYHRSLPEGSYGTNSFFLNLTDSAYDYGIWGTHAQQTSTYFTNGSLDGRDINVSGATYVAYLYAHDTASDGIIQCGSFTADASGNATVDLGWEPQWLLYKHSSTTGNWHMKDDMRGYNLTQNVNLFANLSNAESSSTTTNVQSPTATGFTFTTALTPNATYVYMAIRRGPMRTPTLGTSVFSPDFFGGGTVYYNSGFPTDLALTATRAGDTYNTSVADRLRGGNNTLVTSNTNAELADPANYFDNMVGYGLPYTGGTSTATIGWLFRRAPGFFDEVCYRGTGAVRTVNHNLGVAPELIIVKSRSGGIYGWVTFNSLTPSTYSYMRLNNTSENFGPNSYSSSVMPSAPTATAFSLGIQLETNQSGATFVSYLFASCPGVSKVGSYTGTGALQTINCAFTTGARFVLIKRTDSTGDWYVWDSARGIVAGNDPYLLLNSSAAEVTGTNYVDTDTTGFKVTAAAPAGINANGGSYIFLAIA